MREPFAYPVRLAPLDTATRQLTAREARRLRAGQVVLPHRSPDFAYKRVGGSDQVLVLGSLEDVTPHPTAQGQLDEIYLSAQLAGTLALIRQRYAALPVAEWPRLTEHLGLEFAYPLRLLERSQAAAELDPARRQRMEAGQLVVLERDDGHYIYGTLPGGAQVVRLGALDDLRIWGVPVGSIGLLTTLAMTSLVLSGIALPLFVAIRRVWRDLHDLRAIAERLSAGDLQARVPAGRVTTRLVRPLGQALDHMAAHNQRLIEGQRILTTAVSHEIRTPLARMRFALEMLPPLAGRDQALLDGLGSDVARLEQITRAGLSYARLGWQPTSTRQAIPLRELFAAVVEQASQPPHIVLEATHDPGLVLHGDRDALLLALGNLLANAFRHARERVRLLGYLEDEGITLCVDDDGPGVPPERRHDMFLPFRRHSDDDSGLGLGLALVRVVADRHGASSELLTSPLGGARARLHFPLASEESSSNVVTDRDTGA